MSSFYTLFLFILISILCHNIIARDNIITKKTDEINVIPDPSIKCDTCPCDTCPKPIPPPPPSPPPPELPLCPPPPPPPPIRCPPPPSPPPPPKEPPCSPCMGIYSPPPPSPFMIYTSGNELYPQDNFSGGARNDVVMGVLMLVGVAVLHLNTIIL